jgi:hypothetical protein
MSKKIAGHASLELTKPELGDGNVALLVAHGITTVDELCDSDEAVLAVFLAPDQLTQVKSGLHEFGRRLRATAPAQ